MKKIDYQKQGADFLKNTNTSLKVKFLKNDYHFPEDKQTRDIFRITLKRQGKGVYSFNFGQSIKESTYCGDNKPSAYTILTCLTKYDIGSFEDFCSEYGYDDQKLSEYLKVLKIYKAVKKEYEGVNRLFSDVMDKLNDIQ